MGKVAGAVVAMFAVGAGTMGALASLLGGRAELAALALVGAGLLATGQALSGKLGASSPKRDRVSPPASLQDPRTA